jgi:hypothetical protein
MSFSRSAKSRTGVHKLRPLNLKISLTKNRQSDALGAVEGQPSGATEAIMLAHGFTIEMLRGLARVEQREMRAGRQPIKVIWLTMTDIGRLALAG